MRQLLQNLLEQRAEVPPRGTAAGGPRLSGRLYTPERPEHRAAAPPLVRAHGRRQRHRLQAGVRRSDLRHLPAPARPQRVSPAPASGSPPAARSSSATAARSPHPAGRARVPTFVCTLPVSQSDEPADVMRYSTPITILIADDDADDRLMIQEAFEESRLANGSTSSATARSCCSICAAKASSAGWQAEPYPGVILLDLNMPRKDGREALREHQGRSGALPHPDRGPDHLARRGGHRAHLRPGRQLVHHQAGDLRGPGRRAADRSAATGSRSCRCRPNARGPGHDAPRRRRSTTRQGGAGHGRAARS